MPYGFSGVEPKTRREFGVVFLVCSPVRPLTSGRMGQTGGSVSLAALVRHPILRAGLAKDWWTLTR